MCVCVCVSIEPTGCFEKNPFAFHPELPKASRTGWESERERSRQKKICPFPFFFILFNTDDFWVEYHISKPSLSQLTETCDPVGTLAEAHNFTSLYREIDPLTTQPTTPPTLFLHTYKSSCLPSSLHHGYQSLHPQLPYIKNWQRTQGNECPPQEPKCCCALFG